MSAILCNALLSRPLLRRSLIAFSSGNFRSWQSTGSRVASRHEQRFQQVGKRAFCLDSKTSSVLSGDWSSYETAWQSERGTALAVKIFCSGEDADKLVETLLCFGATACTVEDANDGLPEEQEIYSDGPVPWQEGRRQLWSQSRLIAHFPPHSDVGGAVASSASAAGMAATPVYTVEETDDRDWVEHIKDYFQPAQVADDFWIIPRWSEPPDPSAVNVRLEPGLAFGTGDHPTTRLCLKWVRRQVMKGDRVLDYGTGSGILALAALMLGAEHATGIDSDAMAVSSARYNASLNGIAPTQFALFHAPQGGAELAPEPAATSAASSGSGAPVQAREGQEQPGRAWEGPPLPREGAHDVVVANILLGPLVELAGRIVGYARVGGRVGVSGLLVDQVQEVLKTYSLLLDDMQVVSEDGWAFVHGKRKA